MKKKLCVALSILLCTSACISASDVRDLQPTPQQIEVGNGKVNLPSVIKLIGADKADAVAVKRLKEILTFDEKTKDFKLIIGKKGDASVKKYAKQIPTQDEGYYLSVTNKEIVIAGSDDRGTFYGVQTLAQLLDQNEIQIIEIKDYPDVKFRGVVEGFYGTPWSHEARLSQLKFYGDNKVNTYIYGPKDDPYHRTPNWRVAYPQVEAKQIQELVQVANDNKVDFVWAIHPGGDIKWNESDRDALINKFEMMYALGVRSFAVFFDDISGEGTNANKQAELLNYIDNEFIQKKKDVTPLVMCPTEYNKSWANVKGGYLPTLGDKLNPSIHVMWTGDRVCIDISKETLEWVNPLIKRPAYIWWNFPVTDFCRDHLLMGKVYGNATDVKGQVSGFMTNPMEHAEASKIAIYGIAAYTWNLDKYDADKTWEMAVKELMPVSHEALRCFVEHNSDHGPNGHRYNKEESVRILPNIQSAIKELEQSGTITKDYDALYKEFENMVASADILLASEDNKALIEDIKPWVYQFKNVGETGLATLKMIKASKDASAFLPKYAHVEALLKAHFEIDQTFNQNPNQPGVKSASLHVKPFINKAFETAVVAYNKKFGTNLDHKTSYSPHKLETQIAQLQNIPLQIKTNRIIVPPLLEVLKWKAGNSIQLVLDKEYVGGRLEFDFGTQGLAEWLKVKISKDGKQWETLSFTQSKNRVYIDLKKKSIKSLRLTNIKEDREVKLNGVQLNVVL